MATPTEHIAIWILEAIEAEALREPDIGKRRIDGYVLGEVMSAHSLEGADIDRGRMFLAERLFINAVGTDGGTVTYAFPAGSEYLAAHRSSEAQAIAAKREKNEWTLDRRIILYGIIIAALIAILVAVWPK